MTVLARRREVRKQAKEDGFYAVDFAFGPEEAMGAAMLVNTVPAPVVTRVIIKELPRDAYILDIASKPGGTDFACAKEFGIRADLVLGIPGNMRQKKVHIFWNGPWNVLPQSKKHRQIDSFLQKMCDRKYR